MNRCIGITTHTPQHYFQPLTHRERSRGSGCVGAPVTWLTSSTANQTARVQLSNLLLMFHVPLDKSICEVNLNFIIVTLPDAALATHCQTHWPLLVLISDYCMPEVIEFIIVIIIQYWTKTNSDKFPDHSSHCLDYRLTTGYFTPLCF